MTDIENLYESYAGDVRRFARQIDIPFATRVPPVLDEILAGYICLH